MKTTSHEALFWESEGELVHCFACARHCRIPEGKTGFCATRQNHSGTLFALDYGRALSAHLDPIEKKPFARFRPGSHCLSISTYGCNFSCAFCQNHHLSKDFDPAAFEQVPYTPPESLVLRAQDAGADGLAYTYNEPTIFAEYALDTMALAKKAGLYNVWVSNGYMTDEVREKVAPALDAINLDYKGDRAYRALCGGIDPAVVRENIARFAEAGVHVEVTNLVIPGHNDTPRDFTDLARFIAQTDPEIPLHFSRFFPHYKMGHLPPTPKETILQAEQIAHALGVENVYLGNV